MALQKINRKEKRFVEAIFAKRLMQNVITSIFTVYKSSVAYTAL